MGADMLTATIAVPANDDNAPDFAAGHRLLDQITDPALFNFGDPEAEIDALLPDLEPEVDVVGDEGQPVLEHAKAAGHVIIDGLRDALANRETTTLQIAGYTIHISGGLSWGDAPTDAAEQIWSAYALPEKVLLGMGVILNTSQPPSRTNGARRGVTDTDVVNAIALGLGTKSEWSGADDLEWIADVISQVREHPGDAEPAGYLKRFTEKYSFNPTSSALLGRYVADDAIIDTEEQE